MRWLCSMMETMPAWSILQVRDMEPGSAVWIVKPSITNQGAGIAVIDSCAGLRAVLEGGDRLMFVPCDVHDTIHDSSNNRIGGDSNPTPRSVV